MKADNNNESFSKADLLNLESFYDNTKYEWYAAKHRKPSPAELSLVNGLSIECCPYCGGTHFKKSGYYRAMEQEDIVALTAEECSPRLLEPCLMHTRFPYPNGSNT